MILYPHTQDMYKFTPSPKASLFRAANSFRVTWSKQTRHRSELTEKAWENSVHGLGNINPVVKCQMAVAN